MSKRNRGNSSKNKEKRYISNSEEEEDTINNTTMSSDGKKDVFSVLNNHGKPIMKGFWQDLEKNKKYNVERMEMMKETK